MSDKTFPRSIDTAPDRQTERLDDVIGGKINGDVKQRVVEAFRGFGWDQSAGVRTLATAFLESAAVRDAVFQHLTKRAA